MRKEVVYSLLAAAAFPGMAQANAPVNSPVNIQSWTGGTYDTANSIYVSNNGDPISITLGKKFQDSTPSTLKTSMLPRHL